MTYWKIVYKQPKSPSGLAVSYKFAETDKSAMKLAEKAVGAKLMVVESIPIARL